MDRSGGVLDKYTKHKFITALTCIRDTGITLFDPVGRHFYKQILTYSETDRTLNLFVHYTRLVEIGLPQIWKLITLDPS